MEKAPYTPPVLNAIRNRDKTIKFITYPQKDPDGFFAEAKKQYPSLRKCPNRVIAKFLKSFFEQLADEVVNDRYGVILPGGLGVVITGVCRLSERKAKYNLNYQRSKELGVKVPYYNDDTEGIIAKIHYANNIPGCKFRKRYICKFIPCRKLKRAVSAVMKTETGYKKYRSYNHIKVQPVSVSFNKPRKPKPNWRWIKAENERKRFLENYNEFSFD